MASDEVAIDMSPFFQILKDGGIRRLMPTKFAPASDDPNLAVRSKDVIIDSETNVGVRIYSPRDAAEKLSVMVYIHGGAFCVGSAYNPAYHNFICKVVQMANIVAVSVDYRLAPESALDNTYEDSWLAFQWVARHADGKGPDAWLNDADFRRVYVGGESAGGNIANDVVMRASAAGIAGVEMVGLFLLHPFFGAKEEDKLYKFLCPSSSGRDDDPRLNPVVDPRIGRMAVGRVIFFWADKDFLMMRAKTYCEGLKTSSWAGQVETFETEGEGHCFFLLDQTTDKAHAVVVRLVEFLKTI